MFVVFVGTPVIWVADKAPKVIHLFWGSSQFETNPNSLIERSLPGRGVTVVAAIHQLLTQRSGVRSAGSFRLHPSESLAGNHISGGVVALRVSFLLK